MPRLELSNVSKRFTQSGIDTWALREVSLTVEQGEFIAIEGPSGAGKSTLLNILGLLDVPSTGEYRLDGVVTASLSSLETARRRSADFSFVFQAFHLLNRRPVIDSVELGLLYRAIPLATRRRQALAALDRVGLRAKAQLSTNKLSGGEQQRVAIARALAAESPIIVADEPTGNLDTRNSESIVENLRILHGTGCTVILVTHSDSVAMAADRRIQVVDGRIVSDSGSARATQYLPPARDIVGRPSHVRAKDIVRDAAASVRSRIGRSAMLVAAVAIGVGLTVATLGISSTAAVQVNSTFNEHTNKDVTATWSGYKLRAAETAPQRQSIPKRLGALSGVSAAAVLDDLDMQPVTLGVGRGTYKIDVQALNGEFERASRATIHWAPGHPKRLRAGEIIVGSNIRSTLEIGPLEGAPLVDIAGSPYAVVGIVSTSPRDVTYLGDIFVNARDGVRINPHSAQATAVIETMAGAAGQVAEQVPLVINPYHPKQISVSSPADPSSLRNQIEHAVQLSLVVITLITLIGAIVGLANAMVLAVVERRQEFGLRRAIGARSIHVLAQTITESIFIGLAGGVVGLTFGLGSVLVITIANHWAPTFDVRLAPIAILGGVVVGVIGGSLAAIQATRIRPSEALRL